MWSVAGDGKVRNEKQNEIPAEYFWQRKSEYSFWQRGYVEWAAGEYEESVISSFSGLAT
jgi:hypothetical protein